MLSETIICSWKWFPYLWHWFCVILLTDLDFTSACALYFINCPFGSLFWLPRVPIGSLFHKKSGPYWVPISKLGGPYKFWEQCVGCPNHPWAILFFYDTNDISRYFNMMQYIAIFSRYFPGFKLVKNMRNFLQNLSWERLCWDFLRQKCRILCFATKMTYFIFVCKKSGQLKM